MRLLSGQKLVEAVVLCPTATANTCKAESSPLLVEASSSLAVRAEPLELAGHLSTAQGFRLIMQNCLQHLLANQAGVIRADDSESIHQMRIALRRLRAALRLFSRWTRIPQAMKQELRWLDDTLGTARDADVLVKDILPRVLAACPSELELQQLMQFAAAHAKSNRELASAAVDSIRFRRLITDLSDWLESADTQTTTDEYPPEFSKPVRRNARRMLVKRHKSLLKRGKQLKKATPEQRHRTRIAAKNLRYAAEFFRSMYSARSAGRYIRRLATLQESLGSLNDAVVADRLLRQLEPDNPELTSAISFARGYLQAAAIPDTSAIEKVWRKFRQVVLS